MPPRMKYPSRHKPTHAPVQCGETMTLTADPAECYMTGLRMSSRQIIDTLLDGNWASGTRFKTEVRGKMLEYEVVGRTLMRVKSPVA